MQKLDERGDEEDDDGSEGNVEEGVRAVRPRKNVGMAHRRASVAEIVALMAEADLIKSHTQLLALRAHMDASAAFAEFARAAAMPNEFLPLRVGELAGFGYSAAVRTTRARLPSLDLMLCEKEVGEVGEVGADGADIRGLRSA